MSDRHWDDDELIGRLFGLGPEDGHLDRCESCLRRWESIRQRHDGRCTIRQDVPEAVLARQRRAIYARLDEKPRALRLQLMPSLAALLLVLVILTVFKPLPQRQAVDTASDEKAFEEVFKTASSFEPSSIGPVRSLFEVTQ